MLAQILLILKDRLVLPSVYIFKNIVINPTKVFQEAQKGRYDFSIYFMLLVACLITFFKSFSRKREVFNFFEREIINDILSFLSIPQIQWLIIFFSYILFVFLMMVVCKLLLKYCNKKDLFVCIVSISSAGILLQILFFILYYFVPQNYIYVLNRIAFIWAAYLSIAAIKNSQNTSYLKSIMIYIFAGLPVITIAGLAGLAPSFLWLVGWEWQG